MSVQHSNKEIEMTPEVTQINTWKQKEKKKYRDIINKIYLVGESKEWAEAYKESVKNYTKGKIKKKRKRGKEDKPLTENNKNTTPRTKKQEVKWKKEIKTIKDLY